MEILTNYVKDIEHQMKEMTHEAQKMSARRPIWSCILCQGITIPRLKGVPYWCSQYVKISYVINVTSWGLRHNVLNVTPREITYQSLERGLLLMLWGRPHMVQGPICNSNRDVSYPHPSETSQVLFSDVQKRPLYISISKDKKRPINSWFCIWSQYQRFL